MHLLSLILTATLAAQAPDSAQLRSPDGRNVITIAVTKGQAFYSLKRDRREILMPSQLGFEFRNAPMLRDSLKIVAISRDSSNEVWEQPWGEVSHVRDHHNELRVSLQETSARARKFDVVFRAFNDGIAFRYDFPAQPNLTSFEIQEELTEFSFADNPKTWWIPSNRPRLDRSDP